MLVDYQRLTAVKATTMFLIVWNNVLFYYQNLNNWSLEIEQVFSQNVIE